MMCTYNMIVLIILIMEIAAVSSGIFHILFESFLSEFLA